MTCWANEEAYDPEWYQRLKVSGEAAHPSLIIEGLEKGAEAQKEFNRVYVNMEECVCFSFPSFLPSAHLPFPSRSIYPLNHFARAATFTPEQLDLLPDLSAYHPLPASDNVPELLKQRFLQFSSVAHDFFSLNALSASRVAATVAKHGLDQEREVPTVGCVFDLFSSSSLVLHADTCLPSSIHYRGGDKLVLECRSSPKLSWFVVFPPFSPIS